MWSINMGSLHSRGQFRLRGTHTPYIEPVVLVEVAGNQTTIAVVHVVLKVSIVRSGRPPAPVRSSGDERAIVVIPAIDRTKGRAI